MTSSSPPPPDFDKGLSLKYLGLPHDYLPSPETDPIAFLNIHLSRLPPNILEYFSHITTPKQRTSLVPIRNRRLRYANKVPPEFQFENARNSWPELWPGYERRGVEEGNEERQWAQSNFLGGNRQHVGKLGNLLGGYEEEREAERVRDLRRRRTQFSESDDFVPEEDTDSEEEDEGSQNPPEQETAEETKSLFERRVRERFIYGLLDNVDYDKIDWDEMLGDDDDKEAEARWFDEDE